MLVIILVNYKSEKKTIEYLNGEISKITLPHKVVVVNNAATSTTDNYLSAKLKADLITDITAPLAGNNSFFVLSSNENLGFAKGNNLGVDFARKNLSFEYILFSNNDIRFIDQDVVERLVEKLKTNNKIGAIGPRIIGLDNKEQSPEPYYPFYKRHILRYLLSTSLSISQKNKYFELDYPAKAKEGFHYKVMGSFFMVRATDYLECGMMDNNTFLYGEEVILSERLKKINKKCYYLPNVTILHEHSVTISDQVKSSKIRELQYENELYYYENYIGISRFEILISRATLKLYNNLKEI